MNKQSTELLEKQFDTIVDSPGGIKKLRELILTLAMQGKLVEQDPDDQPAAELIAEIEEEKKRLIAEGKIKKQKPLPEIEPDEVPYKLPEGWEWVRLSEIGQINPKNITDDMIEAGFVPMTLIEDGIRNCHTFETRVWREIKKGYTHIADGDIGVAKITPCFENRKSCIFSGLPNGVGAGTTELHIFRNILPNILHSQYLLYYVKNSQFIYSGKENMTGTAGQQRVPRSYFSETPFPLPPLKEQTRIVQKIDSLMTLCDKLEVRYTERNGRHLETHASAIHHLLNSGSREEFRKSWNFITRNFDRLYTVKENVEELKKAILTLAMQGKLVEQDPDDQPAAELIAEIEEEKKRLIAQGKIKKQKPLPEIDPDEVPYELPEGWEWVRIRLVAYEIGQKVPDSEFTYIDVSSINNSIGKIEAPRVISVKDAPSRARKIVFPGTVIYSTVRPYLQNIAIIEINPDNDLIASTAFAVMYPSTKLNKRFLYYYLFSPPHAQYVEEKMKGVAYPAISEGDFSLSVIPLPPLKEQTRIVQKIDSLMALCDSLLEKIEQKTAQSEKFSDAVLDGV